MFTKLNLEFGEHTFEKLLEHTNFEDITNGRKGTNLLIFNENIPLVRTTTNYIKPAQKIKPIHRKIVDAIVKKFKREREEIM